MAITRAFAVLTALIAAACWCSAIAQAPAPGPSGCSVLAQIRAINSRFADVVEANAAALNTTADVLDSDELALTWFVPEAKFYDELVFNMTYGFKPVLYEAALRESMQLSVLSGGPYTLTEAEELTAGGSVDSSGNVLGPGEGYTFFDGVRVVVREQANYMGRNVNVTTVLSGCAPGNQPQFLGLVCAPAVTRSDIEACQSILHVIDSPMAPQYWRPDSTVDWSDDNVTPAALACKSPPEEESATCTAYRQGSCFTDPQRCECCVDAAAAPS